MKNLNLNDIFKKRVGVGKPEPAMAWPVNFVRDWKIIVLIFAFGLVSISFFAWQIYLSDKIGGGYLAPETETTDISVKTIDQKRLQAGLLLLEKKQTEFQKLKVAPVRLIDPSL